MTVKRRQPTPDRPPIADLADMPDWWLVPFCEGSPTMRRHIAEHRHQREERENANK